MTELKLGLSPCPNDTFIFHALLHGLVELGEEARIKPVFADVERLNGMAVAGELPVTKISMGAFPAFKEKYRLLDSGSALGWGCGPILVAREERSLESLLGEKIAIPGKRTTANMLLDATGYFEGPREETLFSEIIPAVAEGRAAAGVIIHEGRFTYHKRGLKKILDLGEWWEDRRGMPLPLGGIAIRRDVDPALGRAIEKAVAASARHARQNPGVSRAFVKEWARELADEVIDAHIATFVTDFSESLGAAGRAAVAELLGQREEEIFFNAQGL